MKTMKILLGLIVLLLGLPIAHAWKMLPPEGSVQSITNMKVYHGGDTLIEGKHYQQVRWTVGPEFHPDTAKFWLGLREDTVEMKVYAYGQWYYMDNYSFEWEEFLLYDFGVEVGDTVSIPVALLPSYDRITYIANLFNPDAEPTIIISIDTIMIDGVACRRFNLNQESQCRFPTHEEDWCYIEGIGHRAVGFVFGRPSCAIDLNPDPVLLCMHNPDGVRILGDRGCYTTIDNKVLKEDIEIPFYPNPSSGLVNLNPSKRVSHYEVIDMSGRSYGKQVCSGTQIDLRKMPKAYYILRLWEAGEVKSYKLFVDPSL